MVLCSGRWNPSSFRWALLRLGEIRLRPVRERDIEDVEDHRNASVITENPDQLDKTPVTEEALYALVAAVADPALLVKFVDEIEDGPFVLGGFFRGAASLDVADRLRLHAGLLSNRRMGMPLILGAPQPGGAQDRKFRQPRLKRGLEAQEGAELLGQITVLGRMHIDAERAAKLDAVAARSSAHGFEQCALGVVELVLGYYRQAVIQLLGGHAVLVSATSEWRPQGRTFFRAPGKGLADDLTFAAERPELLRLTLR